MLKITHLFIIACIVTILNGCAVGVTHQYDNAVPVIKATAGTKIGVGVQDRRAYVISKNKPETFVGLSRGGFGNPFDVNTTSGKSLADDFSKSISTALSARGVTVTPVTLPLGINESEAIKRLSVTGDKSVLVILNEWKADTFSNTSLAYDVQALIIDANGKVISSKKITGTDNLGGSAVNPPEHSRNAIPIAFRKKLEELFASPEIASHL